MIIIPVLITGWMLATLPSLAQVGIGTTNPTALLHTYGIGTGKGNVVFVGSSEETNPGATPVSGSGTRMMWYPNKSAFRAGTVSYTQWDSSSVGQFSTAFGFNPTARGDYSFSAGYDCVASGIGATTFGAYNSASGFAATAMGYHTKAQAYASTVIGRGNVGGGNASQWVDTDPLFEIGIGTDYSPKNALTILKNGNVGIGVTNPAYRLVLSAPGSTSTGLLACYDHYGESKIIMRQNSNGCGQINVYETGSVHTVAITGDGDSFFNGGEVGIATSAPAYALQVGDAGDGTQARANAWNLLSDERLKKDFTGIADPLGKIGQINGYYFFWNTGVDRTRQVGFSAQEVRKVMPEVVSEGSDGWLSVEYSKLTPVLLEAVKELSARVEELERKLAAAEEK